ncbi:ABC1 kinase family protein [Streptomyces sedi]|uniref:AarF/ABC1/UbiB kinase family protein n=1 Tax=Streptomyces sedi TaxID=555059 RepID=A0A5C4V8A8_9ACTN|nr:AarF/UbiB family protein [Streptomyces sedi]TNM32200.1 AarF/ABC1/UbiB kinase family protein [Streptomyces sedi]
MELAFFLVIAAATLAFFVAALSAGAGRILGLRLGLIRATLTGGAGAAVFWMVGQLMGDARGGALITVQLGLAAVAALLFLALSEVLLPTGSLANVVRWPGRIRRQIARTRRYSALSRIAIRHGLGSALSGRGRSRKGRPASGESYRSTAINLRLALEEAGATFVKVGQLLSTRYDLLPMEFIEELAQLQHQVAPEPTERITPVLREALGADPSEIFAEFDPQPLAAGSMAQVYRARLHNGDAVAVKVQRPSARDVVEQDLDILFRLSSKLEQHTDWGRNFGATELAAGFAASLHEELDLRVEARNMVAIAASAGADDPEIDVAIPRVYEELSSERVLVLEWLDGVTLDTAGPVLEERGLDPTEVARRLLRCLLQQIMTGGVFHADPHPGNIMLLEDGRLVLLDFGSVGRIDRSLRSSLQTMLLAIHRQDPAALCDAMLELVERHEDTDADQLERSLGRFMAKHLAPGGPPDQAAIFAELFVMVTAHGLRVPPELAAVFRAIGTITGSVQRIAPDFDLVEEAQSLAAGQIQEKLTPEAAGRTIAEETLSLVPVIRRLPRRIDRITDSLEGGRLGFQVRLLADPRDRRFIRGIVNDVLLSFLGGLIGLMGVLLLRTDDAEANEIAGSLTLYDVIGLNLLMFSGVLVLRVIFSIIRAPR